MRRDETTGGARGQAFAQAERAAREGASLGLAPNLDAINKELVTLAKGEQRGNPAVQKLVKYVQSEIANPEGITPQQLYTVRKVLTGQLKTGINEDIGAAAAASRRETMGVVKGIDENLDGLSDGAWSQYLAKNGAESKDINKMGQKVCQDAGLSSDPALTYFVGIGFPAAGDTAGDLSFVIEYTVS